MTGNVSHKSTGKCIASSGRIKYQGVAKLVQRKYDFREIRVSHVPFLIIRYPGPIEYFFLYRL